MTKSTTFSSNVASSDGSYLWSNAGNWSNGVPTDGDAVTTSATGVDDIASLSGVSVTLIGANFLTVEYTLNLSSFVGLLVRSAFPTLRTNTAASHVTIDSVDSSYSLFDARLGTITVNASRVENYDLSSGATLEFDQQPQGVIQFFGNNGANPQPWLLVLHKVPAGTVLSRSDFSYSVINDTIELPGTTLTALSVSGDDIKITTDVTSLEFANVQYSQCTAPTAYTAQVDPATGLLAVTFTACYAEGTRIATDRGERAIEELAVGDRVVTVSGECRPVRWVGRRRYAGRALAGRRHLLPIRFAPGSLGDGLPRRELVVSPLHAMLIDGVLVPAHLLVNGSSIVQDFACRSVHYLHIELDTHDAVWAEGAASETFVDDDSRWVFENARERAGSGADEDPRYCAPRVEDGAVLEAIRRRLAGVRRGVIAAG